MFKPFWDSSNNKGAFGEGVQHALASKLVVSIVISVA